MEIEKEYEKRAAKRKELDEKRETMMSSAFDKNLAVFLMEEYNIIDQWCLENGYRVSEGEGMGHNKTH